MGAMKDLMLQKMENCQDCEGEIKNDPPSCIRCGSEVRKCEVCLDGNLCDYCNHLSEKMKRE